MSERKLEQKFIYIFKEDNPQNKFERYLCQTAKIESCCFFKCPIKQFIKRYMKKQETRHIQTPETNPKKTQISD